MFEVLVAGDQACIAPRENTEITTAPHALLLKSWEQSRAVAKDKFNLVEELNLGAVPTIG